MPRKTLRQQLEQTQAALVAAQDNYSKVSRDLRFRDELVKSLTNDQSLREAHLVRELETAFNEIKFLRGIVRRMVIAMDPKPNIEPPVTVGVDRGHMADSVAYAMRGHR